MRANPVPAHDTDYTRLITPALERPEPPTGERAIRLARWREYWRMRETPDPPRDIPPEQMPSIMSGRGGCRNSRGGRPRVLDEFQDLEVAALHEQRWGSLRIARWMGVSRSAVLSSLGRTGTATYLGHGRELDHAPAHRPRGITPEQTMQAEGMRAQGVGYREIALALGVSLGRVRYVLAEAR
jgi:hypothetical protein